MGLYLNVEKLDGTPHPEWEFGKYSGDRDFVGLIEAQGGLVQYPPPERFDPWQDATLWFRPTDPATLDLVAAPVVNVERWARLVRILREDPDYWLRLD